MGPYAKVDYNLTLCPFQIRFQHIYHGQPYARVDLNPYARVDFIFQSWTLDLASVLYFRESIKVEDFSRDHPLYQSLAPLRYMN
jgi:hypothetical protein